MSSYLSQRPLGAVDLPSATLDTFKRRIESYIKAGDYDKAAEYHNRLSQDDKFAVFMYLNKRISKEQMKTFEQAAEGGFMAFTAKEGMVIQGWAARNKWLLLGGVAIAGGLWYWSSKKKPKPKKKAISS